MNRKRPTARRKGESEACSASSCSGFPSEEHYGDKLAAKSSEKLDWKHSIVDLMKLVDMESSLSARKELAHDLHYSGDMNDSVAMNI
jgi:hypothetical protein